MKYKEITYSISGKIPVASYQNLSPFYSMSVELEDSDKPEEVFSKIRLQLKSMFESEASAAKADHIKSLYDNIRFYTTDGGAKYPSVTSILGWDTDWRITEDELRQYGSRGTIVHKLIEEYVKCGDWVDPTDPEDTLSELLDDVNTVLGGSLGLHWNQCSHKAFMAKFEKDFEFLEMEQRMINDELKYAGRCDAVAMYEGKRSIVDFKTGTTKDFRQLAAYAACEPGIEQLVICPVGKTDNKCGYMKPVVCTDIKGEFSEFQKARITFRKRFGV